MDASWYVNQQIRAQNGIKHPLAACAYCAYHLQPFGVSILMKNRWQNPGNAGGSLHEALGGLHPIEDFISHKWRELANTQKLRSDELYLARHTRT
jgi:hypothetical protein